MRSRNLPGLVLIAALSACQQAPTLPVLFAVPPATLISDAGTPVGLEDLRGKVAIYDFVFTHCAATCPMQTRAMQALTRQLNSPDLRFVTISVDPTRDTPEVMARYARQFRTDDRWLFLTGDRDRILELSVKGFKLAAEAPPEGSEAFLHSTRFVVVDGNGMIRGYYDSASSREMGRLVRDVRSLLSKT